MLLKTVKVTNIRNVVVQIPATVVGAWAMQEGASIEFHYDAERKSLELRPTVQHRGPLRGLREGLAADAT